MSRRRFVYERVIEAAQAFVRVEASSGAVLLAAAVAAMAWANSPWREEYFELWGTHVLVDARVFLLDLDLRDWINDGLMTLFFFLMGLEIKRELVHGELSSPRRALLPAAAALGGMVAPAAIYTAFNAGGEGADGWGVPMATDIAFALGVLSLLSRRIPFSLKVFLLALAIADDIGAVIVIAVFYTAHIDFVALGFAALTLASIVLINRSDVRDVNVYLAAGVVLWVAMQESGVHATIGGVVLGLMTPATHYYSPETFPESAAELVERYRAAAAAGDEETQRGILSQIEELSQGTEPPLDRLERAIHVWVSFAIVPLFALANTGVHVSGDVIDAALDSDISRGAALGLVLGKPAGIFVFTWLAVRLKLSELPRDVSWLQVLGVGLLGGIGFTVALLIADIGFEDEALSAQARLGVLAASVASGIAGFAFLYLTGAASAAAGKTNGPSG